MSQKAEELKQRTKRFALDVLAFVRTLPQTDEGTELAGQLRRSGVRTAANYRAACRSRSRAEFPSRMGVALEEADESAFWLEVITEGKLSASNVAFQLLDEARQLTAIFAQSCITSTEHIRRR